MKGTAALFSFALLIVATSGFSSAAKADQLEAEIRTTAPIVTVQQSGSPAARMPKAAPAAGGRLGSKNVAPAGCCNPPGPDGLHCCDTRDCGWFDCGDSLKRSDKKYR